MSLPPNTHTCGLAGSIRAVAAAASRAIAAPAAASVRPVEVVVDTTSTNRASVAGCTHRRYASA